MKHLICINIEMLKNPSQLGLDLKDLLSEDIIIATVARQCRNLAKNLESNDEVWIVASDDMEPLNVAAAIKSDNPNLRVKLTTTEMSGSIATRAQASKIDAIVSLHDFIKIFHGQQESQDSCDKTEVMKMDAKTEVIAPIATIERDSYLEDEIELEEPKQHNNCWIMSVVSGSGGTGKSAVSALSGNLLSALQKKVLLIDADMQFGDMRFISGSQKIIEFEEIENNMSLLCPSSNNNGLSLLASPSKLEYAEHYAALLPSILKLASSHFDAIVINTSSFWSDVHAFLLRISTLNLFLLDQRGSSIRSCKHALELCNRLNLASHSFAFALNNCSKKSPFCGSDISSIFSNDRIFELSSGGDVVEQEISAGNINKILESKNPLAMSVFEMLSEVCPLCCEQKVLDKRGGFR